MTNKTKTSGIVSYMNDLLSDASGYHSEAQLQVDDYRASYYNDGTHMNNEIMGEGMHRGFVSEALVKDVMRTIEGSLPSLVAPFIEKDIAVLESDTPNEEVAAAIEELERLVNYQWNKKSSPLDTVERLARNLQVDGTAWAKTGWDEKGYPTIEIVPFESVIPDPNAYLQEDMKFVIHRRKVSISDILSNPKWFGKHTLETLSVLSASSYGNTAYEPTTSMSMGRSDTFDMGQKATEMIEIFEFYGEFDDNEDGIAEPMVIIWSNNLLLNKFDSPFPGFTIPFDAGVYLQRPYSVYGSGVAELIGEHQRTRQEILRGIIDNMNKANNGTKFVKKGAFDPKNFMRFMNHEEVVEVNHNSQEPLGNAFWDGNYNQIPPEVYKLMEAYEVEQENLSGITKYAVGSDSRSLNQTATGVSIITSMSQRRLVFITQHISDLISRVLKKWILMDDEFIVGSGFAADIDLFVKAGTAGLQSKKVQDISNMLSALAPHAQTIDPMIITDLVADMAENMDLDVTAKKIRDSAKEQQEAQRDPENQMQQQQEQMMMKQIAMREKAAEISKDEAKAKVDTARAHEIQVDTANAMYGN